MKWKVENNKLIRDFEFSNFVEAVSFVNNISNVAEKLQHHPDILIHEYKKVKVMIYTHSENKITDLDYSLASEIDNI